MPGDDQKLLDALGRVTEAGGAFSFGIVNNTLSVTEQLEFSFQLKRVARLVRARVDALPVDPARMLDAAKVVVT